MGNFEGFGLKIGIMSGLNEYMKICEQKRSRLLFDLLPKIVISGIMGLIA